MKQVTKLLTLLLALLLVGCSASRPTTTTATRDTTTDRARETTSATADEAASPPATAPTMAPQDWYHLDRVTRSGPGLDTHAAYRIVLKNRPPQDTVQVAIIDSGIDADHEDLSAEIWTNRDEIPGNKVDDDGNGYVDDVHGWNFIGGPNGENVNADTYELTRIYVKLRKRFGDVDSSRVAPDAQPEYRRYLKMKKELQKERRKAKQELKNVRRFQNQVEMAKGLLREHLTVDTLTQETVESASIPSQRLRQARKLLTVYYDQGPEALQDYVEYVERKLEYNYNPDFNPRPIVRDDYSDKTERVYGNNDVVGPDAGHGTHVAGIVGATRNNGVGIDGIARGVQILPIRTVPNGDERDKDVANAIRYAVDNGAEIINMSFGKSYSPHKDVVDAAVQYADSMGVLMVHAAGNDGANVDSTTNFPTPIYEDGGRAHLWIEVGASSWKGGRHLAAPFSNYGADLVDVFAPGQAIYSTTPGDKYERNDGTSMAAPMVSGLAALIMAHYPSLTAAEVRSIVLETAVPHRDQKVVRPGGSTSVRFEALSRTGAIVNARAALERASEMAAMSE